MRKTISNQQSAINNKFGFTLIELTVVMVLIAILATAGLSTYLHSIKRGRDAQRKMDLGQIQKALETYFNDKGQYPAASSGQIAACNGGSSACAWGTATFEDKSVTPGALYMKLLPKDPVTSQQYFYRVGTGGVSYQIYAKLESSDDPQAEVGGYLNTDCGGGTLCNYGVSSSNTTP